MRVVEYLMDVEAVMRAVAFFVWTLAMVYIAILGAITAKDWWRWRWWER